MLIQGLQKLTLLDYPEHMACTVFSPGCNFRCPFCHNASLVKNTDSDALIAEQEFFKFLETRKSILQGVCVTGGEPTLQKDLPEFLEKIKDMGFLVKLDTNGYRPDILKDVVNAGLVDYVAMDIKNSKEKYAKTAGIENFDINKISESVEFLMSGNIDYEFRTTVVKELHNQDDLISIGRWLNGAKKYSLQKFEDSGDLLQTGFSAYENHEMEGFYRDISDFFKETFKKGF